MVAGALRCGAAIALGLLTGLAFEAVSAQSVHQLRPTIEPDLPTVGSTGPASRTGGKSPVLAAVLNGLVLPGLGNFYAGSPAHGFRHVGLHFAGAYLVLKSTADESEGTLFKEDSGPSVVAGLVILTGNLLWSIFSGIDDARAASLRAADDVAAELAPRLVPPSWDDPGGTGHGGRPRLGIRIVHISF